VSNLRLFLLHTVLLPGMDLPLNVFESRYRRLVSECLEVNEPFGVALIREGFEVGYDSAEAYSVGCTARIVNTMPSGGRRLMISTRGEQRFRIVERLHEEPYPSATVEYPVDELSDVPESLVERAQVGYRQLRRLRAIAEGRFQREIHSPSNPGTLADRIATAANEVVEPVRLQQVLEAFDVHRRLETAVELLTPIVEAAHEQAQIAVTRRFGGPERLN
jgi:Lon protease-like protein